MNFGILNILQVVGSLGIFIYGMKLMSESIQKAAGDQFRQTLNHITSNKWSGFIIGFALTGLIQSSSATTVMTVSFVNAGLISAVESIGLILGANVGTTVTGWIVSLFGFKVSLSEYAVPLFAFGVPMMFVSGSKIKYWGEFIVGLSMIFLGLSFMREAVPVINEHTLLFEWLKDFAQNGLISRLFFVLVGIFIAVLVQSSSVAMAITLTMCAQGWLPVEIAASLILGENIGTTSTALIASVIANREARLTARIHFFFNFLGAIWMVIALPWFLPLLSSFLTFVFGTEDIYKNALDMTIGLSAFHTAFNLINALIFINFVNWLSKIAEIGLKNDNSDDTKGGVTTNKFLENVGLMPEIATIQLQKETKQFGEIIFVMSESLDGIVNTTDNKKQIKLIKKIKQLEITTDALEIEITEFVTHLAKQELTSQTSLVLRKILNICNDLERIADIYYQISLVLQKKIKEDVYFLPEQRENINEIGNLINDSIIVMNENLSAADYRLVKNYDALKIQKNIKKRTDQIRKEHLSRLGATDYNIKSAMVYINCLQSLEDIGDHIINVTESIVGEV